MERHGMISVGKTGWLDKPRPQRAKPNAKIAVTRPIKEVG
jgi:hypothetical protein